MSLCKTTSYRPSQKKRQKYNNNKPWITKEINELIQHKHKLFKRRDSQWKQISLKIKKEIKKVQVAVPRQNRKLHPEQCSDWYKWIKKAFGKRPQSFFETVPLKKSTNVEMIKNPYSI